MRKKINWERVKLNVEVALWVGMFATLAASLLFVLFSFVVFGDTRVMHTRQHHSLPGFHTCANCVDVQQMDN